MIDQYEYLNKNFKATLNFQILVFESETIHFKKCLASSY